jgi:hypothetical protein
MGRLMIRLVLKQEKFIRGEVIPSGTLLLEGECAKNFCPNDIHKAMLLNQIDIYSQAIPEEASVKKESPKRKKGDVTQNPA